MERSGPGGTVEARKLGPDDGAPDGSSTHFSYAVLDGSDPAAKAGERRRSARQRTKLRSGKLIHPGGQFITECLVHNRSASGCHLRVPAGVALPPRIDFYDDQTGRLFHAVLMWRKDRDVGLRLLASPATGLNRATAERMRRKFYVLPQ